MTPRKSAQEISDAIIAQMETSLNTKIPLFPKAFNRILAKVLGGMFVLLYNYAGFILLQMFVKTATDDTININGLSIRPLSLWGELVDIIRKIGQRAEHQISINVLIQGGTISSGERIVNPTTEIIYTLIGDTALDDSTVTATVRATTSGVLGNVDVATVLSFVSPPETVEKDVTVLANLVDGVDPEEEDDYRDRVLDRYAARPQGGAYSDYRDWAQEVTGVLNAYPYSSWTTQAVPDSRAGQVFVYVESASDTDGIPTQTLLDTVKANIELDESGLASQRNINAYVYTLPISRLSFDVSVFGLSAEDTDAAQDAIDDAITDYMLDREPYILGLTRTPRRDTVTQSEIAGIAGNVAASFGGTIDRVILEDAGSEEIEKYYLQEGEKAKLGSLIWS